MKNGFSRFSRKVRELVKTFFIEKCVPLFFTVIRLDLIGISGIFDRLNCILDALSACFFIGFNKNRNLFGIKPIKDVEK